MRCRGRVKVSNTSLTQSTGCPQAWNARNAFVRAAPVISVQITGLRLRRCWSTRLPRKRNDKEHIMRTPRATMNALLISSLMSALYCGSAAGQSMQIVNPSAAFQSCGPDAPPGCEHVLLKGEPNTGPSQHVYRFPAGFKFVKHWHVSNENLVMTAGSLIIASDGTPETRLNVGDYLHIPAKVVHWGTCVTACAFYLMVDGVDSFNVVESK